MANPITHFDRMQAVDAALSDPELSDREVRVLVALARMARINGRQAGWAWPHQATLAERLGGKSRDYILRAVAGLAEKGRIEVKRTPRGNRYRVRDPLLWGQGRSWDAVASDRSVSIGSPSTGEYA